MQINKTKLLKKSLIALAVISTAAIAGGGAVGGTTAGSFDQIFVEVKGLLVGAPGKIIATLAFGAAMFNVVKQNFIAAAGAFVGALMMAFAGDVIDTIFLAGI